MDSTEALSRISMLNVFQKLNRCENLGKTNFYNIEGSLDDSFTYSGYISERFLERHVS